MKKLLTAALLTASIAYAPAQPAPMADVRLDQNGNVQNSSAVNFATGKLKINNQAVLPGGLLSGSITTSDSSADNILSPTATGKKAFVLQLRPSETSNPFEIQSSAGSPLFWIDSAGSPNFANPATARDHLGLFKTFNVKTDFGAAGDTIQAFDFTTTVGGNVVTSAAITSSSQVGKSIGIEGAGATDSTGRGVPLVATITSVNTGVSPHQAVISVAAANAVTGATGIIGTDDTTAFQNAINAVDAGPGNGLIDVMDGHYFIAGPIRTPTGLRLGGIGQLVLPARNIRTDPELIIIFQGSNAPALNNNWTSDPAPLNQTGAIIYSYASDATPTHSIFNGGAPSSSPYDSDGIRAEFRNITFRTYNNPKITALNLAHLGKAVLDNVQIDNGNILANALEPTRGAYGAIMPGVGNWGVSNINEVDIAGYGVGIQWSEHSQVTNARIRLCSVGVELPNQHHASHASTLMVIASTTLLHFVAGVPGYGTTTCPVAIDMLRSEHNPNDTDRPWAVTGTDIDDPHNYARGYINVRFVASFAGAEASLAMNGGNYLTVRNLYNNTVTTGNTDTAFSTNTPPYLSLGNAASAVNGTNLKLRMYEVGASVYGLGVSTGGHFDFVVPNSGNFFDFWVGASKLVSLSDTIGFTVTQPGATNAGVFVNSDATTTLVGTSSAGIVRNTNLTANNWVKLGFQTKDTGGNNTGVGALGYQVTSRGAAGVVTSWAALSTDNAGTVAPKFWLSPLGGAYLGATSPPASEPGAGNFVLDGNITLSNHTATPTSAPTVIDLGASYSSSAGVNPKVQVYNDGSNKAGVGVSSGQLNLMVPTGWNHVLYVNGVEALRVGPSQTTLTSNANGGPYLTLNATNVTNGNRTTGVQVQNNGTTQWAAGIRAGDGKYHIYDVVNSLDALTIDPSTGVISGNGSGLTSLTAANLSGIVLGANGGTGVANTGKTITLGGNLTTSGAFATTLTATATTSLTLPISGTVLSDASTISGNQISGGTLGVTAGTNLTGTAANLTAGHVTTNANLTGDVTSVGNATTLANIPVVSGANLTGTAANLTAGHVTTDANLTGDVTSVGNATTVVGGTNPTFTGLTVDAGSLILSGNQSAAAWTTNGLRLKGITGTLTDTTSSGTVAAAYTNKLGGNTIAASSATTFTDYISLYLSEPAPGTNVTITNKWALGADSLRIGTSNPVKITSAGVLTSLNAVLTTPDLGTPSALVGTNITGTAASLTAGHVTTNANLTGDVTSSGNATTLANIPAISGANLTNLTSANLTGSHTLPDGVLSANVPLLNGTNAFTGSNSFSSGLTFGNHTLASSSSPLINDLGATLSSTAGANLKLQIYNDGTNIYGLGVSSSAMDYGVPASSAHVFYVGGTELFRLSTQAAVQVSSSNTTFAGATAGLAVRNTDITTNNYTKMSFQTKDSGGSTNITVGGMALQTTARGTGVGTANISFATANNAAPTEKMWIDANGGVTVNSSNLSPGANNFAVGGDIQTTSLYQGVSTKAANYTMTATDAVILANAGSGSITITLPSAAAVSGKSQTVIVKRIDTNTTNTVTVSRGGSDTIFKQTSGATSLTLSNAGSNGGDIFIAQSDGSSVWYQTNVAHMADVQFFSSTGANTWNKPGWATATATVSVSMIGAGGAGGSGACQTSGTACSGGAGGGIGGWAYRQFLAATLGSTETVTIGTGGTGGTGAGTTATGGNPGVTGGNSSFGNWMKVNGSTGGGGGGLNTTSSGGNGPVNTMAPNGPGGAGVNGGAGTPNSATGSQGYAASGPSGGGISTTPAAFAGGAGNSGTTNFTAGAAGANTGGAGGNASGTVTSGDMVGGAAGGGGGASITGNGGAGGTGIGYGFGGSGGGSCLTGFTSGAGGAGGNAAVMVITQG